MNRRDMRFHSLCGGFRLAATAQCDKLGMLARRTLPCFTVASCRRYKRSLV